MDYDINLNGLDIDKLENAHTKFRKFRNVMTEIYNSIDTIWLFGNSEKELINKLEKDYNLKVNDIVSIGYGGYIRKSDIKKWNNINKYYNNSYKNFLEKDYYNVCACYLDLLWNYECRISYDGYSNSINEILNYLGVKKIENLDKELRKLLVNTEKYYNNEFDKINY